MIQLTDIVMRSPSLPWSEGDNIPWNDPEFSNRMLAEHLTQAHDAASRRYERIDRHVDWIHRSILKEQPARALDLGCGPGLYTARLAARGHGCTGIDFSPASIAFAREQARIEHLDCVYQLNDLRKADFGAGYDLVMLIYGEVNVFPPMVFRDILRRAYAALNPGGTLLLESSTAEAIRRMGAEPATWSSAASGLFSARPHLTLEEHFWHEEQRVATNRYYIIDTASGAVMRYAASYQAYTTDELWALAEDVGFREARIHPSLTGAPDGSEKEFFVLAATRRK